MMLISLIGSTYCWAWWNTDPNASLSKLLQMSSIFTDEGTEHLPLLEAQKEFLEMKSSL
jgi:hypothetical protein